MLGEADGVDALSVAHQPATHIVPVRTNFGKQHPALATLLEETGESVSFAPSVLPHRFVKRIARFIARGSAGKAAHWFRLRAKESRGATGYGESGRLAFHNPYHRFALWVYAVAESDVVVTHLEVDVHHMHFALLTLSVLPLLVEGKIATVGTIGDYRFLDVAQCVVPCYCLRFPSFPKADVAGEVSQIGTQAQGRILEETLPFVVYIIYRCSSTVQVNVDNQLPVRADNLLRLRPEESGQTE